MATLIVETPEGVELRQELAGAGTRFAAALIDLLFFGVVAALLGLIVMAIELNDPSGVGDFVAGLYAGGMVLLALAYAFAFSVLRDGQTPGKRALGIRVVSADGSPARTLQHLLRTLLILADILPLPIPIGFGIAAATPRRQRLGDFAAGTVVVRLPDVETVAEPWTRQSWADVREPLLALGPQHAARLTPADVAFLRDVATRTDLDEAEHRRVLAAVARAYATRLGLSPPQDAQRAVRELLLFARSAVGAA